MYYLFRKKLTHFSSKFFLTWKIYIQICKVQAEINYFRKHRCFLFSSDTKCCISLCLKPMKYTQAPKKKKWKWSFFFFFFFFFFFKYNISLEICLKWTLLNVIIVIYIKKNIILSLRKRWFMVLHLIWFQNKYFHTHFNIIYSIKSIELLIYNES